MFLTRNFFYSENRLKNKLKLVETAFRCVRLYSHKNVIDQLSPTRVFTVYRGYHFSSITLRVILNCVLQYENYCTLYRACVYTRYFNDITENTQ